MYMRAFTTPHVVLPLYPDARPGSPSAGDMEKLRRRVEKQENHVRNLLLNALSQCDASKSRVITLAICFLTQSHTSLRRKAVKGGAAAAF